MQTLLLLPLLLAAPAQEPITAPTQLDRVTVYQSRALVERLVELEAESPGPQVMVVGPLPLSIDETSLQTKVESGSIVVQGLELRRRSGSALAEGERAELQEKLFGLRAERRQIEARVKGVETGIGALQSMMKGLGSGGGEQEMMMSPEKRLRFFIEEAEKLDKDLARLEAELVEMDRRIRDASGQLESGRRGVGEDYLEARLSLFFERAGGARLRLSYLSHGASWTPTYDVRVDPNLTDVEVGMVAQVSQRTGEDWSDAQIVLSTSTPSIGLDPPSVPRRWMSFGGRRAHLGSLGYTNDSAAFARAEAPSAGAMFELAEGEDADFLAAPTVSVQDLGLTAQFLLPERKNIPSNGKPHRFMIRSMSLDVRPERYVVPSLSEHAYLRAEVTLDEDTPLLPGVAKVFLGPDFLGEASMPLLRRGDSTTLNLGIDHSLSVDYEMVEEYSEYPGRFSLSSTAHKMKKYRAKLKLSASAHGTVTVLVEDALPVSQDDRITIKPWKVSPAALAGEEEKELFAERGLLRWKMTMKPGAETVLEWGYDMAFPYKMSPQLAED